jgi:thymidine kinase
MNNTDLSNSSSFIPAQITQSKKMNASSSASSSNNVSVKLNNEGYLELILGPMFSGKTSTLKKIYDQCMYCNIPVIVINYEADNRYGDASFMSTHDKVMIPCIKGISILEILEKNKEKVGESEVILINEGQFFEDIHTVIHLVENLHKRVYICGLDGDFKKNKIGSEILFKTKRILDTTIDSKTL